ncbi:glycoside hydrolase family 5 protein [Dactylosporangium sp. NPDC051541]|uniref:glycoside hydrolase family 5 protein n=1 Tax=Dactylosporangium sp. NPDC051541 TaxID=3363977 RepID=UPI0037B021A8
MVRLLVVRSAFPALLLALLGAAYITPAKAASPAGLHVAGGRLVEAGGEPLVLRGLNHGYAFGPGPASVFDDIRATGANAVRVALSSGHEWPATRPAAVAAIVEECKAARLICVLDVHDTMGYGTQPGAASIAEAVDYWLTLRDVLRHEERYVVLNIANEPSGHAVDMDWVGGTEAAIGRLRAAGFAHALMVDAPNWGNDAFRVMYDHAAAVFAADPLRNLVFDVHMYGTFDTAAKVADYLGHFVARKLPIVVGEFSALHEYGDPDEDAIMAYCQAQGLGYLGWSWSGNSSQYHYLDVVSDFRPGRLTAWGHRLVDGPDGLRATARPADVYGRLWLAAAR